MAASELGYELIGPYGRGRGGPGGWIILDEPELHLGPEPDIVVPDLAGWRRQTMPELPDEPYITLRPDWVGEVLSPSTQARDRGEKLRLYLREGVVHVWLIDPAVYTLEVFRLDGESYRLVGVHSGPATVQAEPFDAAPLELASLWLRSAKDLSDPGDS